MKCHFSLTLSQLSYPRYLLVDAEWDCFSGLRRACARADSVSVFFFLVIGVFWLSAWIWDCDLGLGLGLFCCSLGGFGGIYGIVGLLFT
ncbi:hypothetical protein F4861DRAFT_527578 [Xylaria intraflava]|nr:hypothetical protein F4861DRAFT_527578 [Xylaria intraflava]